LFPIKKTRIIENNKIVKNLLTFLNMNNQIVIQQPQFHRNVLKDAQGNELKIPDVGTFNQENRSVEKLSNKIR
jgi:hypothetical protein